MRVMEDGRHAPRLCAEGCARTGAKCWACAHRRSRVFALEAYACTLARPSCACVFPLAGRIYRARPRFSATPFLFGRYALFFCLSVCPRFNQTDHCSFSFLLYRGVVKR